MTSKITMYIVVLLAVHLTVTPSLWAERRTLFTFGAPQGAQPSDLVRGRDDRLYGVTSEGGAHGKGALYVLDSNNHPSVLYSFTGGEDGLAPSALQSGADGALYGLSERAQGQQASSVLFRSDLTGALQVLHTWDPTDATLLLAANPRGGVFAATQTGRIDAVSASGATRTLYSFSGGARAGTLSAAADGQLYGTTTTGAGTASLFRLSSDGQFTQLASFASASEASGAEEPTALVRTPWGSVYVATSIEDHGALYRWRGQGPLTHLTDMDQAADTLHSGLFGELYVASTNGGENGSGAIYRLASDGRLVSLHDFGSNDGVIHVRLASSTTGLYGITSGGGTGFGTVFRVRASGDFSTLHAFQYPDGASPSDLIWGSDGALYGTTLEGGPSGAGTVFTVNADGQLRTLNAFTGSDGARPTSLMQASDGNLYGRTSSGSKRGFGTWFRLTTAGQPSTLYMFDHERQGEGPAVVQAPDNKFYAVDDADSGHIVQLGVNEGRRVVYTFPDGESRDGFEPNALLLLDGAFYGTTAGARGPLLPPYLSAGTIFKLGADEAFTTIYAVKDKQQPLPPNAASPRAMFVGSDKQLYGITPNFAFSCPSGTIWRFNPKSNRLQLLHAFTGRADGTDPAALTELRPGVFYGMTYGGQGVPKGSTSGTCESNARNATLFRYAAGRLTTVDTLPFAIDHFSNSSSTGAVKLVAGADGKVYGAIGHGERGNRGEIFVYSP